MMKSTKTLASTAECVNSLNNFKKIITKGKILDYSDSEHKGEYLTAIVAEQRVKTFDLRCYYEAEKESYGEPYTVYWKKTENWTFNDGNAIYYPDADNKDRWITLSFDKTAKRENE